MGYAWEAILYGSRDPCMGHRLFCATEDCARRCAKVSTYIVKVIAKVILIYEGLDYFNSSPSLQYIYNVSTISNPGCMQIYIYYLVICVIYAGRKV